MIFGLPALLAALAPGAGGGTWPNGYTDRLPFVIGANAVPVGDEDITNYNLWFREFWEDLKDVPHGGRVVSDVGLDVRFEFADGTVIDHELEQYDADDGGWSGWLRIPTMRSGLVQRCYMYFGKASPVVEYDWAATYPDMLANWLTRDGTDRSGNGLTLFPSGGTNGSGFGMLGRILDAPDYLDSNAGFLNNLAAFTVLSIVRPSGLPNAARLIRVGGAVGGDADFTLQYEPSILGRTSCWYAEYMFGGSRRQLAGNTNSAFANATQMVSLHVGGNVEAGLVVNGTEQTEALAGVHGTGGLAITSGDTLRIGAVGFGTTPEAVRGLYLRQMIWGKRIPVSHVRLLNKNMREPRTIYGISSPERPTDTDHAPRCSPIIARVPEKTASTLNVPAAVEDPDGQSPVGTVISTPAFGQLTALGGTGFRYIPFDLNLGRVDVVHLRFTAGGKWCETTIQITIAAAGTPVLVDAGDGSSDGGGGTGEDPERETPPGWPYPASRRLRDLVLDWSGAAVKASGSERWTNTWANDGTEIAAFHRGPGFAAVGNDRSVGLARLDGNVPASVTGINLIGSGGTVSSFLPPVAGYPTEGSGAGVVGHIRSLLATGTRLFAWITPGDEPRAYDESRLVSAPLPALTPWTTASWRIAGGLAVTSSQAQPSVTVEAAALAVTAAPRPTPAGWPFAANQRLVDFVVVPGTAIELAAGTDNWGNNQDTDGTVLGSGGDGGGFVGGRQTGSRARRSLVWARFSGTGPGKSATQIGGNNLLGDGGSIAAGWQKLTGDPSDPAAPTWIDAKNHGFFSNATHWFAPVEVEGTSMQVSTLRRALRNGNFATKAGWSWTLAGDGVVPVPTALQAGPGGNQLDHWYLTMCKAVGFFEGSGQPGGRRVSSFQPTLWRCLRSADPMVQANWQVWTGTTWSATWTTKGSLFNDTRGGGVRYRFAYNPVHKLFMIWYQHSNTYNGNLTVAAADVITGPYTIVHSKPGFWNGFGVGNTAFMGGPVAGCWSADGLLTPCVFTGRTEVDSCALGDVRFTLGEETEPVPARSPHVPADYVEVWKDEFDELSLEGGVTSPRWLAHFGLWNAHALESNGDEAWKDYGGRIWSGSQTIDQALDAVYNNKTTYLHEVSGGTLKLRCYPTPASLKPNLFFYNYVAGMISGEPMPAVARGYFECRIKINSITKGMHLAVWLLRKDTGWPPEIDMMEAVVGDPGMVGKYAAVYHAEVGDPVPTAQAFVTMGANYQGVFNYIGCKVDDFITVYYNGTQVYRTANTHADGPGLYPLVTWEVGSTWPGDPDGTTVFPGEAEVDSWRVYRPAATNPPPPPPPPNLELASLQLDAVTRKVAAPGTTGWVQTWRDDGQIAALWRDGGGFGSVGDEIPGTGGSPTDDAYDDAFPYGSTALASKSVGPLTVDWASFRKRLNGSDNWPCAQGLDGLVYSSWGDGNGAGAARRSLGILQILGNTSATLTFRQLLGDGGAWGNRIAALSGDATDPAVAGGVHGKCYSLFVWAGKLWMWYADGGSGLNAQQNWNLRYTTLGQNSWTRASWTWQIGGTDALTNPFLLRAGPGYSSRRDEFFYCMAINHPSSSPTIFHSAGQVVLARCPVAQDMLVEGNWQWFTGKTGNTPNWSTGIANKQPVMTESRGISWNPSCDFIPGLDRWVMIYQYGAGTSGSSGNSRMAVRESLYPWGPWRNVGDVNLTDPQGRISSSLFFHNLLPGSAAEGGRSHVLISTGSLPDGASSALNPDALISLQCRFAAAP